MKRFFAEIPPATTSAPALEEPEVVEEIATAPANVAFSAVSRVRAVVAPSAVRKVKVP